MANFTFTTISIDTHGLDKEFAVQAIILPKFMIAAVRDITREIQTAVREAAPKRGDRVREPWMSTSHTLRGVNYARGNLARAVFARAQALEGQVGIDEEKAPYAKFVVFPTAAKFLASRAVFPDTRPGHRGVTSGTHFEANPVNNFMERGLERANIEPHVQRLAMQAGNLPHIAGN